MQKQVTEPYVVDALSFTEAEARIIEEMSAYISGAFDVHEIDRAVFKEIFFSDDDMADKWYKSKVQFITIDERSEKEKKTSVYYLVQGSSLENARKNIDEVMGGTMIDYVISSVSETTIMDVFEYKENRHHEEEIPVTKANLRAAIGCRLSKRVLKSWKEDFIDEDTKEVVSIDRNEIIVERLTPIDEDNILDILESGVKTVTVYKE